MNSLGVVYIVVHLEKKGKNKKEKKKKRKKYKVTWNVSAFGASPLSVMS